MTKNTYADLREFMAHLERQGELVRVKTPVCTHLEMTEIQTRLIRDGGPAVLFENVIKADGQKSHMPVLVNLFGTVKRVSQAISRIPNSDLSHNKLRAVGEELAFMRQPDPPKGIRDAPKFINLLKTVLTMTPKTVKSAPCQQVVITGDSIDLNALPIQGCWPNEPAPLITWGLCVSQGPNPIADRADNFNLGIYRMQQVGKDKALMRWLKHRGGAQHHQRWQQKHTDALPVAVVIGADPATILAAVTPVPDTMSEYQFAGLLRDKKTLLVKCKTVPLSVPAHAEIILEGSVSLDDYRDEGPYGDHTGYYNSVEKFPVFTCTAITMRQDPIYLSTYTSRPPDEPSVLGEALNDVFVPLIQQQFPEIKDFWLPPEGCSYRIAVISIKKAYAGHAKRIMMGAWSYLRQFMYTKWIIVVDDTIDARCWKQVWWAVSTKMDPARDITVLENTPIDYLDFASPETGLGSKIGLDATDKVYPETHREWGKVMGMDEAVVQKVSDMWDEMGLPEESKKPIW